MKFSIRDLLFVTVIVALTVGWWLERSRNAPLAREAQHLQFTSTTLQQEMEKGGYTVQEGDKGILIARPDGTLNLFRESP